MILAYGIGFFTKPSPCSDGEGPGNLIAGVGNVLRHDYHETYPTVLWDTCTKDLMPLRDALVRIGALIAGGK